MKFLLVFTLALLVEYSVARSRSTSSRYCEKDAYGRFTFNCNRLRYSRARSRCKLTQQLKCNNQAQVLMRAPPMPNDRFMKPEMVLKEPPPPPNTLAKHPPLPKENYRISYHDGLVRMPKNKYQRWE